MAWFCKRCDDFLLSIGEDYCEYCKKRRAEEESKRRAEEESKRRAKKAKMDNIITEINKYKTEQVSFIKRKYNVTIDFKSEDSRNNNNTNLNSIWDNSLIQNTYENTHKIKITYKPNSILKNINSIKKELKELKELEEALKELEDIKNETL